MSSVHRLEERLGIRFRDKKLLEQALVHRSFLNENPEFPLASNERLEFLGDAILGLIVSHELYSRFPAFSEGELTSLRSALVRGRTLARQAESLHLGSYLLMGHGEESSGGRRRQSNLANVFEAAVGALFLDQGYDVTREFILDTMVPEMDRILATGAPKDPKSQLQELLQARGLSPPTYGVVDVSGPDHSRVFTVEVVVSDRIMGQGTGKQKIEAEREAATQALGTLDA